MSLGQTVFNFQQQQAASTVQVVPGTYVIRSQKDRNKVMQVSVEDDQSLIIGDYNGGKRQQLKIQETPTKNMIYLVSMLNNHGLEISNFKMDNGAKVFAYRNIHGNTNQQWALTFEGYLVSALNNKCLDIGGGHMHNNNIVHMWDKLNLPHQKWILEKV